MLRNAEHRQTATYGCMYEYECVVYVQKLLNIVFAFIIVIFELL